MSTGKRRQPEAQRVFLTTALANPAIREIEAEGSDPAPFSDVVQSAAFGIVCGGFAALVAHGLVLALARPGYAMQLVVFGLVALVGTLIRAGQVADSRRGRQWARFDELRNETVKAPEFVPVSDGPRTLVLDTALRGQLMQFAQQLPGLGYSLTYRQWTGQGKLFSRQEFDRVRGMMAAQGLMKGNALTDAGRAAVGRWAVGGLSADEVHGLRSPTPAATTDMHDD